MAGCEAIADGLSRERQTGDVVYSAVMIMGAFLGGLAVVVVVEGAGECGKRDGASHSARGKGEKGKETGIRVKVK